MKRSELVEALRERNPNLDKRDGSRIVADVFDIMYKALMNREDVPLLHIGILRSVVAKARTCTNPHTRQQMEVPPKDTVRFKMSKKLKDDLLFTQAK